MIGAGAGAASAVGSAAASGVGSLVTGILFGGFNPKYSKEHGRKIRYIQQKYAEAYGDSASGNGDPNTIIHNADPNSKLKMTTDGLRPANPFPDERAYEDALMMNFHPTPGHQGKYCASHATVSVGVIIQYQKNRCVDFDSVIVCDGYCQLFLAFYLTFAKSQEEQDICPWGCVCREAK